MGSFGAAPVMETMGPSSRKTGLTISEIMYNPPVRTDLLNLEFIELYNSQPIPVDLSGYRLQGDIEFTFPAGSILQTNKYLVIAAVPADVQSAYKITGVLGPFSGSLPNSGGSVRLLNRHGVELLEVDYSDAPPWPAAADGAGHSLVLARPSYGENEVEAWGISDSVGGGPGLVDTNKTDALRAVVINEILAHTDLPLMDFVELYNHGTSAVDLSGSYLSDDPANLKFKIPSGTVLPPNSLITFTEDKLGFSLSSEGETVYFVNAARTRVIDAVRFTGQANGVSYGRFPDAGPMFHELATRTPGSKNSELLLRDIVINEIFYNPISKDDQDEFIELFNKGTTRADLSGWRFVDGIQFEFPANTFLDAGAYLVVAKNAAQLKSNHPTLSPARVLGDYGGTLSNSGETIALAMPDEVQVVNADNSVTTKTIWITVDEVTYEQGGKWGQWADGGGSSLELADPTSDNRFGANWRDSDETKKSQWTTVEFTGYLDHGLNAISSVQVWMQGAGECLVDNVEVIHPFNFYSVKNGTFESGTTDWFWQGTHEDTSLETTEGFQSNQSLHLRATGRGATYMNRVVGMVNQPALANVLGNMDTTLRAKVRWLKGHPEVLLRLKGNYLEAEGVLNLPKNLGTPGAKNSTFQENTGPVFTDVIHRPLLPTGGQLVTVSARVLDPDRVGSVVLKYRIEPSSTFLSVTMNDNGASGDAIAGDGIFSGNISGQLAGRSAAFYLESSDAFTTAAKTTFPLNAPTHEAMIRWGESKPAGSFGTYRLWLTQATVNRWSTREKLSNKPLHATFVYNDQRVVYSIGAWYAGSSFTSPGYDTPVGTPCLYNFLFPEDDLFLGTTDFMLDFPIRDNTSQRESTMYWLAENMGLPSMYRRYVRLHVNGVTEKARNAKIYEDSQQPSSEVLEQYLPEDAEGDLYKFEYWTEFADTGEARETATVNDLAQYLSKDVKKKARYRWNWLKRAVKGSTHDYTTLFQLVDAINNTDTNSYRSGLESIVNIDQWMHSFALNDVVANWDSFGNPGRKNTFGYKPTRSGWLLFNMDYDVGLGAGIGGGAGVNEAPDAPLFAATDPAVSNLYNYGPFVRHYYRALHDTANTLMDPAVMNPILDARYAAFQANTLTSEDPAVIKTWVASRRAFLLQELAKLPATFEITLNGGADFTTNQNLVTLTGNAPVAVADIRVNGTIYPVRWTGTNSWELRYPLAAGSNALKVEGLGTSGLVYNQATDNITITFSGPPPVPQESLLISEIMYHPPGGGLGFIEIHNKSTANSFSLSQYRINGVDFDFPDGVILGPAGYALVVENREAFERFYGLGLPIIGEYKGSLDAGGETLTLLRKGPTAGQDTPINVVTYDDAPPWPTSADGQGPSLQLMDTTQSNDRVGNWGAVIPNVSTEWKKVSVTGTAQNSTLLFHVNSTGEVYIDDINLVAGTVAESGQNLVFNGGFESGLQNWNPSGNHSTSHVSTEVKRTGANALRLVASAPGTDQYNAVWQIASTLIPNGTYTLTYYYRETTEAAGMTGRLGQGTVASSHPVLAPNQLPFTPGRPNSNAGALPVLPLLWINEVLPNNVLGPADKAGDKDPWVELYNAGDTALDLTGFYLSESYGTLSQWPFPPGTTLAPKKFLVIWTDGEPGESGPTELHANFRIPSTTGSVVLSRQNGSSQVVVDYLNYQSVQAGHSYGSYPDGDPKRRQYLQNPTVGAGNDNRVTLYKIWINEWMASNGAAVKDPADQAFDDWFELYNPNPHEVNLSRFILNDSAAPTGGFIIPDGTVIPAGGYLLVWADEETNQNGFNQDLHASFKLGGGGDSIYLFSTDGQTVDSVVFGVQETDRTQGRFPDGAAAPFPTLGRPTPRAANILTGGSGPIISKISASPAGILIEWQSVAGATYRLQYTTNLTANPAWVDLPGDVTATGPTASKSDSTTPLTSPRFYRLQVR